MSSSGFQRLKVVGKTTESRTITSLHLEPVDPRSWRSFEPGQFLVFKIPAPDGTGHVLRNYSVSSAPGRPGGYRVTVKREMAPAPGVPNGFGSNYLHDAVTIGDVLMAEGPRGEFVLDRSSQRPVVLLSGGVGLTPLVSMLHSLAEGSGRTVRFIHACDDGDVHALGAEVRALARSRPGITTHTIYRTPSDVDRAADLHDFEGLVTRKLLQDLLPLDDYDVYLCGPPPFMNGVYTMLRGLGVSKERITYEFFGPATLLESESIHSSEPSTEAPAWQQPALPSSGMTVTFARSGREAEWTESTRTLLDFAEAQGLEPPFSCRAGVCSTCLTRIVSGALVYLEEPLDDPQTGFGLICCSKPAGPIVLDL